MAHRLFLVGAILMALTTTGTAQQLPTKRMLTLDAAKRMIAAAEAESTKNGWTVAVSVVDDGGNLIAFTRQDNTKLVAIDISMRKAKTAVFFQGPTKALEEEVTKGGRTSLLPITDFMPLEGGIPIVVDGKIVGAIGVSGMSGAQDAQCASAGLAALGK